MDFTVKTKCIKVFLNKISNAQVYSFTIYIFESSDKSRTPSADRGAALTQLGESWLLIIKIGNNHKY